MRNEFVVKQSLIKPLPGRKITNTRSTRSKWLKANEGLVVEA